MVDLAYQRYSRRRCNIVGPVILFVTQYKRRIKVAASHSEQGHISKS